jgi:hypothetical protein
MLKFLRIITWPVYKLSAIIHLLIVFPWKDGKSYAQYLILWKWASDEDTEISPDQLMEHPKDEQSKKPLH